LSQAEDGAQDMDINANCDCRCV